MYTFITVFLPNVGFLVGSVVLLVIFLRVAAQVSYRLRTQRDAPRVARLEDFYLLTKPALDQLTIFLASSEYPDDVTREAVFKAATTSIPVKSRRIE